MAEVAWKVRRGSLETWKGKVYYYTHISEISVQSNHMFHAELSLGSITESCTLL